MWYNSAMNKLSTNDRAVLIFLREYRVSHGKSPTLTEIRDAIGWKSLTSVQRALASLEENGFLEKQKNIKRGIEPVAKSHSVINLPLVGSVPCGTPLLAVENIEGYIPTDSQLIHGDIDQYFYLRALGDSMDKSGIEEGDLLLIKSGPQANNGEVVVALIDDSATVKRLRLGNGYVKLEPDSTNNTHKPIVMREDFSIQGVVKQVVKDS